MQRFLIALSVLTLILSASCTSWFAEQRTGSSSSLVDYLYPGGKKPPPVDEHVPVINLPARVGVAFVPSRKQTSLGDATMSSLLNIVRDKFQGRDFIERIELIPAGYLRARGGFKDLDQIAQLYNLDLIALVSYNQIIHSEHQTSSVLYWTIVGAYVIKGTSNDVSTLVDTAVFDLSSRTLLFRAPGQHRGSDRSTHIGTAETSREMSEASFTAAMTQMTANLDAELDQFKDRIKQDQSVRLVHRGGSSGGAGSADLVMVMLAVLGLLSAGRKRKA